MLVDPDDDDDVRTAIELSETKPTGKGAYATPVRVNGKEFYRKAVEIKPKGATYADYLADMAKKDTKNSRVTLTEFFGGGGKKGELFEVFGYFFPGFPILNQTDEHARLRLKGGRMESFFEHYLSSRKVSMYSAMPRMVAASKIPFCGGMVPLP